MKIKKVIIEHVTLNINADADEEADKFKIKKEKVIQHIMKMMNVPRERIGNIEDEDIINYPDELLN